MHFSNLKEIIEHIEKTVICPHCSSSFIKNKVEVLYLHGSKMALVAHCVKCSSSTTIVVSEEAPKARSISIKKRAVQKGTINMNDVLDMRSFIQGFKGNFKDSIKE
jgi:hypothetical protein